MTEIPKDTGLILDQVQDMGLRRQIPANDTFYVVRFVFVTPHPEYGYDTDHSDVWTNPIFVDRI